MIAPRLRYVEQFRDRHGKPRIYYRRPGHRKVPLAGPFGSPAFLAAYTAAHAAAEAGTTLIPSKKGEVPRSLGALIVDYYGSTEYRALAPSSLKAYRAVLERLRVEHGHRMVAEMERKHVVRLMDDKADVPGAANRLRQMLRQLMQHAVERAWRSDNPVLTVRKAKYKKEPHRAWTEAEIAQLEARWPLGTTPRLAFALLLYTGQRLSDAIRMGRPSLRGGLIHVVQQKTGTPLAIPLHPRLHDALAHAPADHLTFLTTQWGAAFTAAGFSNWLRDKMNDAALPPDCKAHGLRKTAARMLAEAGCSPHQIQSITGHKTLTEVTRYTAEANQQHLAAEAMKKVTRMQTRIERARKKGLPNPLAGVGQLDVQPIERKENVAGGGGAEGNRTPDLLIANEALSHLSYSPRRARRAECPSPQGKSRRLPPGPVGVQRCSPPTHGSPCPSLSGSLGSAGF